MDLYERVGKESKGNKHLAKKRPSEIVQIFSEESGVSYFLLWQIQEDKA